MQFSAASSSLNDYIENRPRLFAVIPEKIDEVWKDAKPFVERAVEYADGMYTVEYVYQSIKKSQMQLWLIFKNEGLVCACVTQVFPYPSQKVLLILFAGGNGVDEWLPLIKTILDWGKSLGCEISQIWGRKGWIKKLRSYGFEMTHVVLRAKL